MQRNSGNHIHTNIKRSVRSIAPDRSLYLTGRLPDYVSTGLVEHTSKVELGELDVVCSLLSHRGIELHSLAER